MSITRSAIFLHGSWSISRRLMLALLVLLLLSVPLARVMATGVAYHVATSGNDNNSGLSLQQAWRNIEKANTALQTGDTVWVHSGTYADSISPNNSGSSSTPIVYLTWGAETVTLNPSTNAAVQFSGKSYVWIRGRFWADHARQALYVYNSHDIVIDGLRADSSSTYGMVKFENCSYIYLYNSRFHKHEEYDNWPDWDQDPVHGDPHKLGDSFQLWNCQFCYMEADTFMGASHYNALPSGPNCHMIYFTRCVFSTGHGLAGMNSSGNSVFWDNCTFKHQFTQNRAGTHLQIYADTNAVRFCTFVQDTTSKKRGIDSIAPMISYYGASLDNHCTYSRFYHNTLLNYLPPNPNDTNQTHSLGLTDSASWNVRHHVFKNNVFFHPNRNRETIWLKSTALTDSQLDDTLSHNFFWRGNSGADSMLKSETRSGVQLLSVSEARTAFPGIWLANNREADPKLTGAIDARPTAISPLIDSAIALTSATNAGSNSTSLQVNDPCYFFPGWTGGIIPVQGDSIKVGSSIRRITAISGNTLTLNQAATWDNGASVYVHQSRHWVGNAPDVGAQERPAFAVDTCLMGTTVSSGQVATMTVARADANYFVVAIGILSSSVQVDSCYLPGSSPVIGTRLLRQTQGISPGLAVELWEVRNPGMGPQAVRVKLASNTEFTWGLVTVNGVDERVSPVSATAQLYNNSIAIINQAIGGNGTVVWATLQNAVTPGTGVSVIGTKSDLSGSRIFTMMKKPNGGGTTFSYTQSPKGPLAAGGTAIGAVVVPPDPGQ